MHFYVFVYCLYKMKTKVCYCSKSLFIYEYSIRSSFPTFNRKMIEFCTLKIVTSTLSKVI